MMSRLSLAAVAVLVAAPAFAGGFAPVVETPPPATPVVIAPPAAPAGRDWSGFYVGGQVAYGNLGFSEDDGDETVDEDFSGALVGVHAGYMHDFGRIVAGAELAYDVSNIDLDGSDASLDSVARLGLRAGYDAGRFLPYVTAGLSRTTFSADDDSETFDGNFLGLGVEYAVSERFSIGAEVLRHNIDFDEAGSDVDVDSHLNTIGIRGSFRF